jgi:hypothetical protein
MLRVSDMATAQTFTSIIISDNAEVVDVEKQNGAQKHDTEFNNYFKMSHVDH